MHPGDARGRHREPVGESGTTREHKRCGAWKAQREDSERNVRKRETHVTDLVCYTREGSSEGRR